MINAAIWEENRHAVLRRPLDALKMKNYRTFTATELVDVQVAAGVLTQNIMPIVRKKINDEEVVRGDEM